MYLKKNLWAKVPKVTEINLFIHIKLTQLRTKKRLFKKHSTYLGDNPESTTDTTDNK